MLLLWATCDRHRGRLHECTVPLDVSLCYKEKMPLSICQPPAGIRCTTLQYIARGTTYVTLKQIRLSYNHRVRWVSQCANKSIITYIVSELNPNSYVMF